MADGNKRYLGDVFINSENYKRQKQFFKDIIESYQWKFGGDFDAATLQGKSASDFATAQQGENADNALLQPLLLGRQELRNVVEPQHIYTDAVRMDREYEPLNLIQWFNELENDDLSAALRSIYDNVNLIKGNLQTQISEKHDTSAFSEFYDDEFLKVKNAINIVTATNDDGEEVEVLDADLVNGLKFRLITQAAYNNLSEEVKSYWRNVFIITDNIPSMYEDPLMWKITDGYEFRIHNSNLEVKNKMSTEWTVVCSLADLLASGGIESVLQDVIFNSDFIINTESLIDSLTYIDVRTINENWENFPFLSSSLHNDFVENITINNSSDYITQSVDSLTKFKNVDIDMNTLLSPVMDDIQDNIDAIQTERNRIDSASRQINTINNQITDIQRVDTSQQTSINQINSQLSNIQNTLSSINSQISSINTKFTKDINEITSWEAPDITDGQNIVGRVNKRLGIVYAAVRDLFTHRKKNTWSNTGDIVYSAYRPIHDVYFSGDSPYIVGRILSSNGFVQGRSISDNVGTNLNLNGTCWWRYK